MGVDMSMYVCSETGTLLTHQQFQALVLDLLHERVVTMPCALLEHEPGDPSESIDDQPLDLWDAAKYPVCAPFGTKVKFHGDNEGRLAEALSEMRFGQADCYVCFDGLDWSNPVLRGSFENKVACQYW